MQPSSFLSLWLIKQDDLHPSSFLSLWIIRQGYMQTSSFLSNYQTFQFQFFDRSIFLSAWLSVCLLIGLSVWLLFCLSARLRVRLFVWMSGWNSPPSCLCVSFVCLPLSLWFSFLTHAFHLTAVTWWKMVHLTAVTWWKMVHFTPSPDGKWSTLHRHLMENGPLYAASWRKIVHFTPSPDGKWSTSGNCLHTHALQATELTQSFSYFPLNR